MKIILPGLSMLAIALTATLAISQPLPVANHAATDAMPSPGDLLIRQVATQLERRESVTSRLRFQTSLDGRQLAGAGNYLQEGSGSALRVRLELRVAGEINLLQVSNGRILWCDLTLPTRRSVSRLDLRQLRSDAALGEPDVDVIEPGQATWSPFQPELAAQTGGLPALITSLEENFTFSPPQAMRWTPSPPLSGVGNSLPVFAVVGRWKREQLLSLIPDLQNPSNAATGIPPARVPQEVLILVGQADLFPYRVEYRRLNDPAVAQSANGAPASLQLSADPLVLLEYYDVSFNTPIAVGQFDYSPGEAEWSDQTADFLDALRRRRQEQLARRSQAAESR